MDRFERQVTTSPRANTGDRPRLDDRYFVPRDVIAKAFAGLPPLDYEEFFTEIDAFANQDSTPRDWPDP